MNSIQTLLRSQRGDSEEPRDPLDVFREFIACLDRAARRQACNKEKEKRRRLAQR
jgi:hypothetical protein